MSLDGRAPLALLACLAVMGLGVGSIALVNRSVACDATLSQLIFMSGEVLTAFVIACCGLLLVVALAIPVAVAYVRRAPQGNVILRLAASSATVVGIAIVGTIVGPYYWIAAPTPDGVCERDSGSLMVFGLGAAILGTGIILLLLLALLARVFRAQGD